MMQENVKIYGWEKCPFKTDEDGAFSNSVNAIWFSPDKTKVVLEVFRNELYVAATVTNEMEECLFCKYVNHYEYWDFDCRVFTGVNWDYLKYGFCKLNSWSMDTGEHFVKRFYFDRKLYLQKYKEENGVPKMRNGKEVSE